MEWKVSSFVQQLLDKHGIVKPKPAAVIPKGIAGFIRPFVLSEEEEKISTNLCKTVTSPIPAAVEPQFQFPADINLESILILHVPRRLDEHKVVSFQAVEEPAVVVSKKPRGAAAAAKRKRVSDGVGSVRSKTKIEPAASATSASTLTGEDSVESPKMTLEKAREIFNFFWEMEIADKLASGVYFGRINENNYKEFGFECFVDEVCNLPIIKAKLENGEYSNSEELRQDFQGLFRLAQEYFPATHNVHRTTLDLKLLFEQKWEEALR